MDPSEVSEALLIFTAISSLAAVLTALIASWSLKASRDDSRERTRPIVAASLQIGPSFVHGAVYIVIVNYGPTAAYNLKVTHDPSLPLVEAEKDSAGHHASKAFADRYSKPIEALAPGQRLHNPCRKFVDGKDIYSGAFPDDTLNLKVTYEDGRSRRNWRLKRVPRTYEDTFALRLDVHDWHMQIDPAGTKDHEFRQRVSKALESVGWELWSQR